jgi:hypothetical protein
MEKIRFASDLSKVKEPQELQNITKPIAAAKPHVGPFSGIWRWQADESVVDDFVPHGLLVIREDTNGDLSGSSLTELPIESDRPELAKIITSSSFSGSVVKSNNDEQAATFEIAEYKGVKTSSRIKLNAAGTRLTGSSITIMPVSAGQRPKVFKYSWSAYRYLPTGSAATQ